MQNALSLKALQAFEAAARTGSFVAAAAELNVSAAAISQLVRGLEARIGRPLFERRGRNVHLTEAGQQALPRLTAAFAEIDIAAGQLTHNVHRARVSAAVPGSMATGWLAERLPRFLQRHPDLDVKIEMISEPGAATRADICLGYGPVAGGTALPRDHVLATCSPEFLASCGPFSSLEELARAPLIETDWGPAAANFPDWRQYLTQSSGMGANRPRLVVPMSHMALQMAVAGQGVALIQGLYAADALADGRLVPAFAKTLPMPEPYYLSLKREGIGRPGVQSFHDWFRAGLLQSLGPA